MIVKIGNGYAVAHNLDGQVIKLFKSYEWSIWLSSIRNCKPGTIYQFTKAIERLWIWSLYNNKTTDNESFSFYLARYREDLLVGYKIKEKIFDSYLDDEIELTICNEKPKAKQTINKELAGIKSYLNFIDESNLIENKNYIDIFYENKKSKKGFLSALDIKKSSSYLETFGKKIDYLKPYKVTASSGNSIKAFPHKNFDALLSISKPREKLIYLLMGACSARIGQALNLTLYDIDYEKEEVWLMDSTSTSQDLYGNNRKKWLFEKYGIDIVRDKEHNDLGLQFKYPIPLKNEPLYWISEKYKKLFFTTINDYINSSKYIKEKLRPKPHPFFFITSSGKRLMARGLLEIFKKQIRTLNTQGHNIPDLGFHSLRHMFGVVMAEVFAKTGDESILFLTKEAMGHNNIDSTLIYFNFTDETKRKKIKEATDQIFYGE